MSDIGWLFVAFAAVWIAIGGYLLTLGARQRRLEQRLNHVARDDNYPVGAEEQIHKP